MKIRTELHAGYSDINECQGDANYWKMEAQAMEQYAKTGKWPSGVPYPTYTYYPPDTYTPTTGGGYVNGVYYPDKSGTC